MTMNSIAVSYIPATKADIAEVKGEIKSLTAEIRTKFNLLMALVAGPYVGLALVLINKLIE